MLWIILVVVLAIILIFVLFKQTREKVAGICNYALEVSVHKQKNIDAILKLFESKDSLTNEEIRSSLKISSRSVVRYMNELEKQGKIKQSGTTGRGVSYSLS